MGTGPRVSTIHSGFKPLYYVYKMTLSIWAGSGKDGAFDQKDK